MTTIKRVVKDTPHSTATDTISVKYIDRDKQINKLQQVAAAATAAAADLQCAAARQLRIRRRRRSRLGIQMEHI